jgi:hypothetical protein
MSGSNIEALVVSFVEGFDDSFDLVPQQLMLMSG